MAVETSITPTSVAPPPLAPEPEGLERVVAPAARASTWGHYREALTSSDFLFAVLTIVLTLVSWGIHLAGVPEPVIRWTGIAAALAGGIPIAYGAIKGLIALSLIHI